MGYPAVPELQPFKPCQRPNLMQFGQYDVTLDEIEKYLNSLGEYVDTQDLNLQEQIDAHGLRIGMLEERMDTAEADIDALEVRMDSAESRLDSAESRLDTAEADIDALEVRMDTAESDIDAAEANITDLQSRVTYIEENPYVLPEATPETLGGVYTVTDSDFYEYIGIEITVEEEETPEETPEEENE